MAAALLCAAPVLGQKTDVIVLENGDRLTGEIKSLGQGQLEYSTDDIGRIYVEWAKVTRVTSRSYFEVRLSSGRRLYGRLDPSDLDRRIVVTLELPDTLGIDSVVAIVPISARFVNRLKASLDIGLSLAKANRATTFNGSGSVNYRGPEVGGALSLTSYLQGQEAVATTSRNSLQLTGTRYFANRWQASVLFNLDQNDELGLVLRGTTGAGVGRELASSNSNEITTMVGLVGSRERYAQFDSSGAVLPDTVSGSLEGLVDLRWAAFRYDSPKLDLSTEITAYPSLSSWGRVRVDATGKFKYELLRDFFTGLTFTDSYDSRPAAAGQSKNDFVLTFTIGWSYRK